MLHDIACTCYNYTMYSKYNMHDKGVYAMNKRVENLVEKYLTKPIVEICMDTIAREFDYYFAQSKANPDPKDTTIGQTTRALEKRAKEVVDLKLGAMMNDITDEMGIVERSPTNNPFAKIACSLWEDFLYYYDIRGYVENIVREECEFRSAKMKENGLLDSEGDYTGRF